MSKATRAGWMQAVANPWGSFILTPECYRCLQLLRARSKTHGLCSTRAGQWVTLRIPHMRQDPPLFSAKLLQGLGLKCQSLEWKAVFLGCSYWGYTPSGPGFGDKEPVTHGVIFKVLPHYLNQQHKHEMTWSQGFSLPNKSNACWPSKQLFVGIAIQIFKICNQNEE